MNEYTDQAGQKTDTYSAAELLGKEHGWNLDLPEGYADALRKAVEYLAGIKSERPIIERFRMYDGTLSMRCRSKYADLTGHEHGAWLSITNFSKANVARAVHTCRECTKFAGRKYIRKRTVKPKAEPEFFVIETPQASARFKTWEEAAKHLEAIKAPSAALIVEGKLVTVRRKTVFVRDE